MGAEGCEQRKWEETVGAGIQGSPIHLASGPHRHPTPPPQPGHQH